MKKIGFIDYYLDEWHANNYPKFIKDAVGDEFVIAYAYGEIDKPTERPIVNGRTASASSCSVQSMRWSKRAMC